MVEYRTKEKTNRNQQSGSNSPDNLTIVQCDTNENACSTVSRFKEKHRRPQNRGSAQDRDY